MRLIKHTLLPLLTLYLFGFGWFVGQIPDASRVGAMPKQLDAIVALTGGSNRIAKSLELLEQGGAPVLFISGVGSNVTLDDIVREQRVDVPDELTARILLGHRAKDTVGNAREVVMHARDKGWKRMLIVTATYHVPRSKLLFSRIIPNAPLYFYAIAPSEPVSWKLRLLEYNKWLTAHVL